MRETEMGMAFRFPRVPLVDAARGIAILGVILFHLVWDLRYFGYTGYHPFWDPFWLSFAKVLANTFLFLVGVSLVLAHGQGQGQGIDWTKFWRRWVFIALCAALISLITFLAFGSAFVYFGILHAIAVFSLVGVALLGLPVSALVALGLAFVVPAFLFEHVAFNQKWLSWIGFWTDHPDTQDLVSFFPQLASTLFGMALAKVASQQGWWERLRAFALDGPIGQAMRWCGRRSLVLYLVHQPIVFGAMWLLVMVAPPPGASTAVAPVIDFIAACHESCDEQGQSERYCTDYCACTVEKISENALWPLVAEGPMATAGDQRVEQIVRLCTAMAAPALETPDVATPE